MRFWIFFIQQFFSKKPFFRKNIIFQNNYKKKCLGAVTIFRGMGRRTTKMRELSFCIGNEVPNTVFKFLYPKNWFWVHIFPHICGSIGPVVSKNGRFHLWVDPHQPHVNFMKISSKPRPVPRGLIHIHIYKYVSILTLRSYN